LLAEIFVVRHAMYYRNPTLEQIKKISKLSKKFSKDFEKHINSMESKNEA
jgi:hypothetical protein